MNRDVNLTKRVRVEGDLRYCPVVLSANGRVKPDWVVVNGREERHPEGAYYIDWREGSRRKRKSVGRNASDAAAARFKREQILAAKNVGAEVVEEKADGTRLADAVDTYLARIKITRKPKTDAAYRTVLDKFLSVCRKQHVEQIDRDDLLKFAAHLRDVEDLAPRTVWNKFALVVSFLKASGRRGLVHKEDWPRFVEEEPEIYEQEDLDAFFEACDADELCLFQFFLMTGMREQEVMHCEWPDVNLMRGVVAVRHKPQFGFVPKKYREREVPIHDKLVASLKKRKQKATNSLLFPASNEQPDGHLLRYCKAVAKRAGLNPDDWWLHKFRSTFATTALRSGADLSTVQMWLGHSDITSTMRYLKPSRSQAMRAMVNAMFD